MCSTNASKVRRNGVIAINEFKIGNENIHLHLRSSPALAQQNIMNIEKKTRQRSSHNLQQEPFSSKQHQSSRQMLSRKLSENQAVPEKTHLLERS